MTPYIGRFAPSPTGPLHFGSLVAALGSFVDARHNHGRWLLRMEDLDPPREVAGAADAIITSLAAHGLHWDASILYQSRRQSAYQQAFEVLRGARRVYACDCSRARLRDLHLAGDAPASAVYPGYCRHRDDVAGPAAWRLRVDAGDLDFVDRVQGLFGQNLALEVGDFVLRRRDGLFAYQLAVVIDDAHQGVTQVVRGTDLLDNTPRQIHLQSLFGYAQPGYTHLPTATNAHGEKLSKQTHARALDDTRALRNLVQAWTFLGQVQSRAADWTSSADFLDWAVRNWDLRRVPRTRAIPIDL